MHFDFPATIQTVGLHTKTSHRYAHLNTPAVIHLDTSDEYVDPVQMAVNSDEQTRKQSRLDGAAELGPACSRSDTAASTTGPEKAFDSFEQHTVESDGGARARKDISEKEEPAELLFLLQICSDNATLLNTSLDKYEEEF
jgi:hypothetical protein